MRMTEKNGNLPAALAVTLAGVFFLPQMLLPEGRGLGFSNSFLSVTVFLLAFPQVRRALSAGWKGAGSIVVLLLSFGFVLACTFGSRLEAEGYLLLSDPEMWLSLPFLTLFFAALLERLYGLLENRPAREQGRRRETAGSGQGGAEPAGRKPAWTHALVSRWESLPVGKRRLIVYNKADISDAGESDPPADIRVSAKTGENIPALRERMFSLCMEGYSADGFLIEERHYAAVRRALAELNEALAVCGKVPPDLLGVHLKAAWDALGEISGETANERIIDEIFSKFCVGK